MSASTLFQLGLMGLFVASIPLTMVWLSSDANKYRKLVWVMAFLTFDLIVFGGFTRLTDSGLGCPDWPGCYGAANPFIAHEQIAAAEALMPTGPVTKVKAWIEMIHRYLAMGIGVLIMALMFQSIRQWRKTHQQAFAPALPVALFLFVCVQGAFGAWTVTLKLQPAIVTIHLLLGMGLLAMLVWLGGREDFLLAPPAPSRDLNGVRALRTLALVAALVLVVQIALGGWVSTNYATMACDEFPLCDGRFVPEMDFEHGFTLWRELGKTAAGHYLQFSALVAIHWVHRNFALVVTLVLGLAAWRAARQPALRRTGILIAAVLLAQLFTGVATVYFDFPLAIAVLHNAGAALLVLLVTMLNYKVKHLLDVSQRTPAQAHAPANSYR
ncbi:MULTISPECIES: heme A synthase [unclassified Massilia]|uniref:COX15/CtaA family protein n=1 Tax=unclassified Massilia TaxID=2609279 RepID=UPI0017817D59|nr:MULTISPECIES: COX15/CtaA family protein [unclassified Massilia]MBD8529228.1 COX15/CtaA family protein [Massilia sp. CFBP 13647]MBD8672622.1 COX15/CtaA family protein [Massilia sp. CFBP 13721]